MKVTRTILSIFICLFIWGVISSYTPVCVTEVLNEIDEVTEMVVPNQRFVRVLDVKLDSNTFYDNIDLGFKYSSFVFEVPDKVSFSNTYFASESDKITHLDSLPVGDVPAGIRRSPFVIPNEIQSTFSFYSGRLSGKLRLYLFYAPPISLSSKSVLKKADNPCEKPELISGTIWREGLPEPVGTRTRHDVAHCIVHHAASSNSNHDYINVVRNIFLLHTQTNGWDDIGYNFVIAQDGTVFEGRDHQKVDSTDNIMGAHFCGKNSKTMGICVLGNYQEIAPTQKSIESLKNILTWKCYKDAINPLKSTPHPSSSSPALRHIAGHREGCATACPGDSLYMVLQDIRLDVDSMVNACNSTSVKDVSYRSTTFKLKKEISSNIVEASWSADLKVRQLVVYAANGQRVLSKKKLDNQTFSRFSIDKKGLYVVRVLMQNGTVLSRKFILD